MLINETWYEGALEEITVTAQKRATNLQDTPISITAFSAVELERRNVTDISGIAESTPSLVFDTTSPVSGASSGAVVFIRGVGQTDFQLTTDPGVGTYIDGVYVSRSIGGVLDTLDLERLEILRGPQGTLFGRNAIGGAISLVTKKPEFEFGGWASVTTGDYGRFETRASINVPVNDKLAFLLSTSTRNTDGYDTRLTDGKDLGNVDRQSARLAGLLKITDDLKLTVTVDGSHIDENSAADKLVGVTITAPGAQTLTNFIYNRNNGSVQTQTLPNVPGSPSLTFLYNVFNAPTTNVPGYGNAIYAGNWITPNLDTTYSGGKTGTNLGSFGTSFTFDWDTDVGHVKSITAYRQTRGTFARDADGSPLVVTDQNDNYVQRQFSEELQLTGSYLDNRLKTAGGVYFFKETGHDDLFVFLPTSFGTVKNFAAVDNSSEAAYAQGTYEVTKDLSLTYGERYSFDRKRYSAPAGAAGIINGPLGVFGTPGTYTPYFSGLSNAKSFNNWSLHAGVDYHLTAATLLYATYSEGYKSGGFNTRYLVPVASAIAFNPEHLDTYEAGTKWQNSTRTLRVNADAFYSNYSDIQGTVYENGAPITRNSGTATLKGFELEATAAVTKELKASFGSGFIQASYDSVTPLNPTVNAYEQVQKSNRLEKTPKWTLNASLDYRHPLQNGDAVSARIDWSYKSTVYNDAINSPFLKQDPADTVDISFGYDLGEDYSLSFFVKNLTDEHVITSGDSNYSIGFHEANFNAPRMFGVTGKVYF